MGTVSKLKLTAAAMALIVGALPAVAQTTLRMANWMPPAHHMQATLAQWIDGIEAATGGSVEIDLMSAPLAPPPGQYDLVRNGVVDIAYGIAAFTPNQFHLFRALEMPFLADEAQAASAGLMDWYTAHDFAAQEFEGTHLIAAFTHAPFLVHSREPVTSLADFDGLKIRAGGVGIDIFNALGAAPVFLAPGDTTEALQRGTVDATQFTWESLPAYRLYDLVPNHLVFPDGGLYGTAFWVAMSDTAWNSLTDEQRAAIDGYRIEGSRLIGARWDDVEGEARATAEANGDSIVVLSDADTAALRERIAFVEDGWIDATGENGASLLGDLRATIDTYR